MTAPGDNVLIPSLYRHLASVPPLFQLIAAATEPALARGALGAAGAAVRRRAQELARRLPLRVEPTTDVSVRGVVERFEPAIASMLVAGRVLDAVPGPGYSLSSPSSAWAIVARWTSAVPAGMRRLRATR